MYIHICIRIYDIYVGITCTHFCEDLSTQIVFETKFWK